MYQWVFGQGYLHQTRIRWRWKRSGMIGCLSSWTRWSIWRVFWMVLWIWYLPRTVFPVDRVVRWFWVCKLSVFSLLSPCAILVCVPDCLLPWFSETALGAAAESLEYNVCCCLRAAIHSSVANVPKSKRFTDCGSDSSADAEVYVSEVVFNRIYTTKTHCESPYLVTTTSG